MPKPPDRSQWWVWEEKTKRYRLTREGARGLGALGYERQAGQFVGPATLRNLRETYNVKRAGVVVDLAGQVKAGSLSHSEWVMAMRQEIKTQYINQYVMARGGLGNMTQADYGRVGRMLRTQYGYLNEFGAAMTNNPQWSERYIAARSQLYLNSSTQAYEVANQMARGLPPLPAYPGDGKTVCLSNCNCYWDIREDEEAWYCTWMLTASEHCPDCVDNSRMYNPLTIPKMAMRTKAELYKHLTRLAA